jgi:hypothetical protein
MLESCEADIGDLSPTAKLDKKTQMMYKKSKTMSEKKKLPNDSKILSSGMN